MQLTLCHNLLVPTGMINKQLRHLMCKSGCATVAQVKVYALVKFYFFFGFKRPFFISTPSRASVNIFPDISACFLVSLHFLIIYCSSLIDDILRTMEYGTKKHTNTSVVNIVLCCMPCGIREI